MLNFPFPLFPYHNYYNRFHPHYYENNEVIHNTSKKNNINNDNIIDENNTNYNNKKRTSKYNSFANINISALLESDLDTPIIEIFGIKLYLDDLIIIGLLFFLYKEDVQDEILFCILLLLLLS